MQDYVVALRQVLLPIQKPVLERFFFRGDHVGASHMQLAVSPFEGDPEYRQGNVETERLLHLPPR